MTHIFISRCGLFCFGYDPTFDLDHTGNLVYLRQTI